MRPDLLNPLFAETGTLDGVGPKLAKPLRRLGLERVRDRRVLSARPFRVRAAR